jgi:hypothetical protein
VGTPAGRGRLSGVLRKIAIVLVVLALAGVGFLVHLWREMTALPEWAEHEIDVEASMEVAEGSGKPVPEPKWVEVERDPAKVAKKREQAPAKAEAPAPKKKRGRRVLKNFHLRTAAKNAVAAKAVRKSRAVYEDGDLEAGVIVNLSKIPKDKLAARDRQLLDRAFSAFPFLRDRAVYVGIEDEPVSRGGFLQLGRKTRVRVGKLEYSLGALARKLDLDAAQVRKQIDREMRRLKLTDPDAG